MLVVAGTEVVEPPGVEVVVPDAAAVVVVEELPVSISAGGVPKVATSPFMVSSRSRFALRLASLSSILLAEVPVTTSGMPCASVR